MRLATWNLLAPEFCGPPPGGRDYYVHVRPFLRWSERLPRIVAHLAALNADLLCLQEVSARQWSRAVRPALEQLGYRGEFAPRPGSRPDGVALLARAPWTLADLEPLPFDDGSEKVALLASVERPGLAPIQVASVHLKWTAEGATAATQGARVAARLVERGGDRAVIAGDLNLDLMRHPSWRAWEAQGWASAYPDDGLPTWAADGRVERTDGLFVRGLRCSQRLPLPTLNPLPGLPTEAMPSDHVPLAAWLE